MINLLSGDHVLFEIDGKPANGSIIGRSNKAGYWYMVRVSKPEALQGTVIEKGAGELVKPVRLKVCDT